MKIQYLALKREHRNISYATKTESRLQRRTTEFLGFNKNYKLRLFLNKFYFRKKTAIVVFVNLKYSKRLYFL